MRDVLLASNEGRFAEALEKYTIGYTRQRGAKAGFAPNVTNSEFEFRCVALDLASWFWLQIGQNLRSRKVG